MSPILTFKTRDEAITYMTTLYGWATEVESLYLPDDENADTEGSVWVVRGRNISDTPDRQPRYMRVDGYVQ